MPPTPSTQFEPQIDEGMLRVEPTRLLVHCASGSVLELLDLQPEGKKRMPARDFIQGYRPKTGERLES